MVKMKKINEKDIFNKFFKYNYKDIINIDMDVEELVMEACKSSVCREVLKTKGSFDYMSSVLEYLSYNSIPVRQKHALLNILGSGEVVGDGSTVNFQIYYFKKPEMFYIKKFHVNINKENNTLIYISREMHPTLVVDGQVKKFDDLRYRYYTNLHKSI